MLIQMKKNLVISFLIVVILTLTIFNNIQAMETNQTISSTPTPPNPNAPEKPSTPIGSLKGKPGILNIYTYTTSTIDLDGHPIYYKWHWGDGESAEWQGPYNSSETVSNGCFWLFEGIYEVKVKAIDDPDNDGVLTFSDNSRASNWSNSINVSINKTHKVIKINPFLQCFSNNLISGFSVILQMLFYNNKDFF
jgi:hypothetical protein